MDWQEVIAHPSLQDLPFKIELNEYGKIEMSPASNRHGRLQGELFSLLAAAKPKGIVYLECSVATAKGVKVSDVAWASKAFFQQHGDRTPLTTAPEICVEVISPSNSSKEMDEKIALYLQTGAKEVWLCDEQGQIAFFAQDGQQAQSAILPQFPVTIALELPN